jgi:hypothetical protein
MLTAYIRKHTVTAFANDAAEIVFSQMRASSALAKPEVWVSTLVRDTVSDRLTKFAIHPAIGGKRVTVYNNFPSDATTFRAFAADALEGGVIFGCV